MKPISMESSVESSSVIETDWSQFVKLQDEFSELDFDLELLRKAQAWQCKHRIEKTLNFHIPSIKQYSSEEITSCGANSWPAISITGGQCTLMCDHCQANVLKSMIPATSPKQLWQVGQQAALSGAKGMLLSGGSNRNNEVNFYPYLRTIQKLKESFPGLIIACHTGLVNEEQALSLQQAKIDCAMIDIIGSQDTITQVYHLRRKVEDFESALCALNKTSMFVIPHIVLGLHYGKLLGEWHALEIIERQRPDALVLVVAMPHFATGKKSFVSLPSRIVGRFFLQARQSLINTPLLLGCARPAGKVKIEIDTYAVYAGLDGIAYPADGIVTLAKSMGKSVAVHHSCCSVIPDMIENTRSLNTGFKHG